MANAEATIWDDCNRVSRTLKADRPAMGHGSIAKYQSYAITWNQHVSVLSGIRDPQSNGVRESRLTSSGRRIVVWRLVSIKLDVSSNT